MVFYCKDCALMDLRDSSKYDRSQYYCSYYRTYYRPGSKACRHAEPRRYVTTAVCDILNLEDKDKYLSAFNDTCNYINENEEYEGLLEQYDITGPLIVEEMQNDNNKENIAKIALREFIKPAYKAVEEEDMDSAIEIYTSLITSLKSYYAIDANTKKQVPVRKRV